VSSDWFGVKPLGGARRDLVRRCSAQRVRHGSRARQNRAGYEDRVQGQPRTYPVSLRRWRNSSRSTRPAPSKAEALTPRKLSDGFLPGKAGTRRTAPGRECEVIGSKSCRWLAVASWSVAALNERPLLRNQGFTMSSVTDSFESRAADHLTICHWRLWVGDDHPSDKPRRQVRDLQATSRLGRQQCVAHRPPSDSKCSTVDGPLRGHREARLVRVERRVLPESL